MDPSICLLVTVLDHGTLVRCAIKIPDVNEVPSSVIDYPLEPESRTYIHSLLPRDIANCGPVVNVETIEEVHIYEGELP